MKTAKQLMLVFVLMMVAISACGDDDSDPKPKPTPDTKLVDIVDTAVADGRFTTLVAAVKAADLVDTLKGKGPFTVFAPTDAAFAKLPAGTVETLLEPANKEQLKSILLYHVVPGKVTADKVVTLTSATTVNGAAITIAVKDGKVYLNDNVQVTMTDVEASNGVIHVIDTVLMPPTTTEPELATIVDTAVADGRFTTLATALTAAGLVDTLKGTGPFTVFAPTDDAFAKLPAGTLDTLLKPENMDQLKSILLYHVVPGKVMAAQVVTLTSTDTLLGTPITITVTDGKVYLNDTVQVTMTDVEASNGVIHVIDSVLIPPAPEPELVDIVDTAVADGRFTTLAAALTAADLVDTLKGEGPFTVFAPTDAAFAKLPAGTVDTLLEPANLEQLKSILLYHVVAGKVMADTVVTLTSADTVNGAPVTINVTDGKVFLNDTAEVILTDVEASNGVIHVIDTVLMPPE